MEVNKITSSITRFEYDSKSDFDSEGSQITASTSEVEVPFDFKHPILPIVTPLKESLCAKYKYSFAYVTLRERVFKILQDLITNMDEGQRRIMEKFGDYARFDLRRVVWSLEILRTEILENASFKMFHDKAPEASDWNALIKKLVGRERNHWFSATWMHAECYFYRRIWCAFQREETLRNFDYFSFQKICATHNNVYLFRNVLKDTRDLWACEKHFLLMLKLSLWSNTCDLSITSKTPDDILDNIYKYDRNLLVDQSQDVWHLMSKNIHSSISPPMVDIVLDNAGFELFVDLLLGTYLIDTKLAVKVRYHVKAIPWFISDVTAADFNWMLNFLVRHEIPEFAAFGRKLRKLMRNKFIELYDTCKFWTRPESFKHMRELAPCLYTQLSFSALVIFKGDLNYRKLLDDINWSSTTPLKECLGGFLPTSICALRCIKSDIYSGLPVCVVEWLTEENKKWMVTGEKAVIQLVVKQRP